MNSGQSGAGTAPTPPAKPPRVTYAQILTIPGNEFCCDCRASDPKWASINLGITLCIECSGIHRSLGVHLSKVRSLNLDAWDHELIKVMSSLGNTLINSIYEAKVDESIARRATPECTRTQREHWIKAKYVKKAFVDISESVSKTEQNSSDCSPNDTKSDKTGETVPKESHNSSADTKQMSEQIINSNCDQLDGSLNERTEQTLNNQIIKNSNESDSEDEDSEETKLIVDEIKPNVEQKVTQTQQKTEEIRISELKPSVRDDCPTNERTERSDNTFYNLMLYKAALNCDLKSISEALAKGAAINWQNTDDFNRTPLHQAILSDGVTVCEYLLLNGAKSNVTDAKGTTPLHMATQRGNTGYTSLETLNCFINFG